MREPARLVDELLGLPVSIESAFCLPISVQVPTYEGAWRPSARLHLAGAGQLATAEHVAFTDDAHEALASSLPNLLRVRRGTVARIVEHPSLSAAPPYARAAIEAAVIDLALRQANTALAALAEATQAHVAVAIVFSLAPVADPAAAIARVRERHVAARFKLDVDPAWPEATLAALDLLHATGAIAILDFKHRGTPEQAMALAARFPRARCEDAPLAGDVDGPRDRFALDAALLSSSDVAEAAERGLAVNVKPGRMGGPLEVLRALQIARDAGTPAYLGGMFELGPARRQSRLLAALYTHEAPNDLAPIAPLASPGLEPDPVVDGGRAIAVRLDRPGF